MGEENFAPVLLLLVLVLDGAFGDFEEVSLPGLVGVQQFELLGDHLLEVVDVHVALLLLALQLPAQLLVDLGSSVFGLPDLQTLLLEDVELLAEEGEFLLEVELALVVEHLVRLVTGLHVEEHLLLGGGDLQVALLLLQLLLQLVGSALGGADLVLVLSLEDGELADLFLGGAGLTFIELIFSSRRTRCFFISSYFLRTSVRLWWAELYSPSVVSSGYTRSLFKSMPVR